MKMILRLLLAFCASCSLTLVVTAQQLSDPEYVASVEHPAYSRNGPRVLFDEGHNNLQTTTNRFKPFVDLLMNDGYRVIRNRQPFTSKTLSDFKVLIISNALGAEESDDEGADKTAFTDEECQAIQEFVKDGGALLLIANNGPYAGAAETLAKRFGVEMNKTLVYDEINIAKDNPATIVFSRENKLLAEHPITDGRSADEKVNKVMTFGGQSLRGPADSVSVLRLSDGARESVDRDSKSATSAAGRSQAIALKVGKGRVMVQGEASMLSAQIEGSEKFKVGMNAGGNDNKQYTLNLMHWLSGLLR
jgi:hypothetical protein